MGVRRGVLMFKCEYFCEECGCKTAFIHTKGHKKGIFARCDACKHEEVCDMSTCINHGVE